MIESVRTFSGANVWSLRLDDPTAGWGKTLDIVTSSLISMYDADETQNSILKIS